MSMPSKAKASVALDMRIAAFAARHAVLWVHEPAHLRTGTPLHTRACMRFRTRSSHRSCTRTLAKARMRSFQHGAAACPRTFDTTERAALAPTMRYVSACCMKASTNNGMCRTRA
eukprot:555469-Pleurochrysis_carterae.AAC.1